MLTHRQPVFTRVAAQCLHLEPDYVTLLFLPLAHVFARLIVHVCMRAGVTVAFAEDLATLPANLQEIRPHFIPGVPRIFEKFHERILAAASRPALQRRFSTGRWRRAARRASAGSGGAPIPAGSACDTRSPPAGPAQDPGGRSEAGWPTRSPAARRSIAPIAEFFDACGIRSSRAMA